MFKACDREPGQQQARQEERAAARGHSRSTRSWRRRRRSRREKGWRRRSRSTSRAAWTKRSPARTAARSRRSRSRGAPRSTSSTSSPATRASTQDEPVLLGVYEFSRRRGEPDCRAVVPMGPPDREQAAAAIARLDADGGTPIGQAMITAKRALDDTGLTRRHLLVVTDGENTDGVRARSRRARHRQAARRRTSVDLFRRVRRRSQPLQPRPRRRRPGPVRRERHRIEHHARHAAAREDPRREVTPGARNFSCASSTGGTSNEIDAAIAAIASYTQRPCAPRLL